MLYDSVEQHHPIRSEMSRRLPKHCYEAKMRSWSSGFKSRIRNGSMAESQRIVLRYYIHGESLYEGLKCFQLTALRAIFRKKMVFRLEYDYAFKSAVVLVSMVPPFSMLSFIALLYLQVRTDGMLNLGKERVYVTILTFGLILYLVREDSHLFSVCFTFGTEYIRHNS